jgi:hypothetical protein
MIYTHYSDLAIGLKKKIQVFKKKNFFLPIKKNYFFFLSILLSHYTHSISDHQAVLILANPCLLFSLRLNHRGSSMNLRFQLN